MSNKKLTIGLVFGGNSSEHEVSIKSAKTIYHALLHSYNNQHFIVNPIYIDKHGFWLDSKYSKSILEQNISISTYKGNKDLRNNLINLPKESDKIDVWFPVLHGPNGEDGVIQGLFKLTGKPFVGSGILGSSLGMDKIAMKSIFKSFNIPQAPYIFLSKEDLLNNFFMKSIFEKTEKIINYPCFVKPANLGSSIGINKAYSKEELIAGIEFASNFDERIIIEKNIAGRELECGVLGKSTMRASVVGEVKFQTDWYTYESKYNNNLSSTIIPADLKLDISKEIQKLAIEACKAINAFGLARVDFFYQENAQQIYINEVNTLPGFTNKSMYPMLWEASGLKLEKLVASLIETARE
ncbi:D-alanine--D-alanine ligase family protein [Prochlorococcus marinus]|uniref:D-alanine--D-alanine ligase n=1 Tax=Prochlorococcus marinus XMU1408 TaxID=2213228 RepID=A0A318QWQ0_PROMR|nr:D-alanine--D-alanine ligase family protein [Prochlorococcus marinus]MBW3042486.1 D-alanine--D-alanine ligase [Prochlorococcus marinus str. XMU1408]PYE01216.1 D-alanine--D-alanine ligase [Prochlorococcus marinus XMU1408]